MRRPPMSLIAAAVVVALGLAGLVVGAIPQSSSVAATPAGPTIIIGGAYVREPASPTVAAAYFTVYNTGDKADVLSTVTTGAGEQSSLHEEVNGGMQLDADGLTIPAHSSVSLTPAKGHVMIQKLYGTLKAGQTVNMQLTFENAGLILITAPVIGILAPAPTTVVPK